VSIRGDHVVVVFSSEIVRMTGDVRIGVIDETASAGT